MRISIVLGLLLTLAAAGPPTRSTEETVHVVELTRPVDVVFALDTSGSMEQLLNASRARIWDVINELARMMPTPELHVGLLTYGADEAGANNNWIVKQNDLTDDLDTVYARLMGLTTAGSEEYVGQVLHEAVWNMNWSRDPKALKIIFLAGNEVADQGQIPFADAADDARREGIIVNALYAGAREQGIVEKWPDVARAGRGNFSAIDPTSSTIQIATPQDERLLELNALLNKSYVPYGEKGQDGLANQVAQDSNASRLGVESCSSRIVAKGTALYTNAFWDLVDAAAQDGFDLASVPEQDLPTEMLSMTDEERAAYINAKRADREAIQTEIQRVSLGRENYIREAIKRELGVLPGLGDAMRDALRKQAMDKGFTCEDC